MKCIIAGSRKGVPNRIFDEAISKSGWGPKITTVVHGGCSGVDAMADFWASSNELDAQKFPADWEKHGKSAGPRRNQEMAKHATHCIAIWDGHSGGTRDMIEKAVAAHLNTYVYNPETRAGAHVSYVHCPEYGKTTKSISQAIKDAVKSNLSATLAGELMRRYVETSVLMDVFNVV